MTISMLMRRTAAIAAAAIAISGVAAGQALASTPRASAPGHSVEKRAMYVAGAAAGADKASPAASGGGCSSSGQFASACISISGDEVLPDAYINSLPGGVHRRLSQPLRHNHADLGRGHLDWLRDRPFWPLFRRGRLGARMRIRSLVVAPVDAASVWPVCRRSWNRKPGRPTRRRARTNAWRTASPRIGAPSRPTNTRSGPASRAALQAVARDRLRRP
jgi:hypothetical protein